MCTPSMWSFLLTLVHSNKFASVMMSPVEFYLNHEITKIMSLVPVHVNVLLSFPLLSPHSESTGNPLEKMFVCVMCLEY